MLPIDHILLALQSQLKQGNAIVVAPPGAGKSTQLPLTLLRSRLYGRSKIIMLQPRRIAVRNIARYLAEQLGEEIGDTVGYRIRGETKVSANTLLEIVTEGVLTRLLQQQPDLPKIGLIIFDEFHERSVYADFALALCLEVQQSLRDDLRLLVMSATLDVHALTKLLPDAAVLESKGKSFPVEVVYRPDTSRRTLSEKMSALILHVFPLHQNDLLVFLPGANEIKRVAERLTAVIEDVSIHCLYGELPKEQQQQALLPHAQGKRKIVLATNIAETSLTIEGIEVVIDSGVEKKAIFQLNRGITHLQSQFISQASATQRTGRAGRLGPGTCYRLWSAEQQQRLSAQSIPEILQTDMSVFLLETVVWGSQIADLALIDYPSNAQISQAEHYLQSLSIVDKQLKLSALGRQIHHLACHPGIANMLLQSQKLSAGHLSMACAIAGLLENKDPLNYHSGSQLSERLSYLIQNKRHPIWQQINRWFTQLKTNICPWPIEDVGVLLGFAFPTWIAKARQNGRYLLANGSGASLYENDSLFGQEWLVVGAMMTTDRQQDDAHIRYAESISLTQIKQYFTPRFSRHNVVQWDNIQQRISASCDIKLSSIVVAKEPICKPARHELLSIWAEVILAKGINALPLDDACQSLLARGQLAVAILPDKTWPEASELALLNSIEHWLLPYVDSCNSWAQLLKLDFYSMLKNRYDWQQWQALDALLPDFYTVPSGRKVPLVYAEKTVKLSVKMPEMYGLTEHPTVAKGKIALTIELLSPAQRPLQTTQDLPGFWIGSYKQIQKEMKGRYPRHFWPDDPINSPATTTTKKKMNLS